MSIPLFPEKILQTLTIPGTDRPTTLEHRENTLYCPETGESHPFSGEIPSLFFPSNGQEGVIATDNADAPLPFPGYEGLEEFGELVSKGHGNPFSKRLLKAIGYNRLILECGCGTGQLGNYLQLNNNHVLGIDPSAAALALAIAHKKHNQLTRSAFVRMNPFNPAIKDESFDVLICHGGLPGTGDPRRAFGRMVRTVKPGGIVLLGLHNRFGRIPARLWPGKRNQRRRAAKEPLHIGFRDPGYHSDETWHTIDEGMAWFEEQGIDYLNCSPPILDTDGETAGDLFARTDPGSGFQRVITQLSWMVSFSGEGGLFDLVGRKKG